MLDADVSRSINKAMKHLRRVRNNANGEMQEQANRLLVEVEKMQDVSLAQVRPTPILRNFGRLKRSSLCCRF